MLNFKVCWFVLWNSAISFSFFFIFQDKKFAVKARLCGMLPITAGLLKRCQGNQHNLVTLLSVVKTLANNCECHIIHCTGQSLSTTLPQCSLLI